MKLQLLFNSKVAAIVLMSILAAGQLAKAQEKKPVLYSDLEKKLTVDKSPLETKDGAIASYADSLQKVMPAVVTVYSSKSVSATRNPLQEEMLRRLMPNIPEDFFEKHGGGEGSEQRQEGLGSGVIVTKDGYILTNNHVVADADEIKVSLATDKHEYAATVVGADPKTDVALIKIDAKGLTPITFGDSARVRIGDVAIAVGNPLGLEQTATIGIISALGRTDLDITGGGYENFIQTDASINRGNSGGALVDAQGRLIGVNTAITAGMAGGNIGIGFAIPSNMALNIVERLLDGGGVVARGFLGVWLKDLDETYAKAYGREDMNGVVVAEVGNATPAETAGMKAGDLITAYDGKPVESMQKLRLDISNTQPGKKVTFDIVRRGENTKLDVELGNLSEQSDTLAATGEEPSLPEQPKADELLKGVEVSDLDENTRAAMDLEKEFAGVVVESVTDDCPAAKAGLRAGMIITQIDQRDVKTKKDALDIMENFKNDVILLQVYRNGRRDILAVELKDGE